jgi:hypothetical protein
MPLPPPGSAIEFFTEIGDSLANTASNIPGAFPTRFNLLEWLLAPFVAAFWSLVLLVKLATLPAAVVIRVIALAPRWLLYSIQVEIFKVISELRWQLALGGLGLPSSDDLSRAFAQLCYRLPPGRTGAAWHYPYAQVAHNIPAFWLGDPRDFNVGFELPRTESCPYVPLAYPSVFIDGTTYDVANDRWLKYFSSAQQPSNTVSAEDISFNGARTQFGGAVGFASMLLNGRYPLTSFDLDADRGYGFLSWRNRQKPEYHPSLNTPS